MPGVLLWTRGNKGGLFLLATLLTVGLAAQNLVPNPGFEAYDRCPPYLGQIHEAVAWDSPNNNTTDFFHRCSPPADGAGVPANKLGRQRPFRGDGYAGIRLWIPVIDGNPTYREYLAVPLVEPLRAGLRYELSFQVSLAESSSHATDALGLYLSADPPGNERVYAVEPQITNRAGKVLDETESWTAIEGTYRAKGGEAFVIIGNFQSDARMLRQAVASSAEPKVYYYIDEVRVEPCPGPEERVEEVDTSLCEGATLSLEGEPGAKRYQWSDGGTTAARTVTGPGRYRVRSDLGCYAVVKTFRVRSMDCACRLRLPNPMVLRPDRAAALALPEGMDLSSLVIFDAAGRTVGSYRERMPAVEELSGLPSGAYFVRAAYRCRLPNGEEVRRRQVSRLILVW